MFFSSLTELRTFFGCVLHLKRLAVAVINGNGDDEVYESGVCKELGIDTYVRGGCPSFSVETASSRCRIGEN